MKLRLLSYIVAAVLAAGPAQAQSQLLLGAGKPSAAAPADCSAFLPANFATSALYISWTTQAADLSWGMACLNGTTPVAANTLGTFSASSTSAGLTGTFTFTNVSWLVQGTGTIYAQAATTTNAATQYFFDVSDGTLTNFAALRTQTSATFRGIAFGGTCDTGFTPTANTSFKSALSYISGAQICVVNGGAAGTSSGAAGSSAYTDSKIGASPTGTFAKAGPTTANAFFSTALDAATLQAITQ